MDNSYNIPNLRGQSAACRTNLPSNTAFRGFGVPQSMVVIENMIHDVASLVSFCSQAFTLEPGDVIATGTPEGVGYFRDPRVLLHDGDVMAIEIEGIGRLQNTCREVGSD